MNCVLQRRRRRFTKMWLDFTKKCRNYVFKTLRFLSCARSADLRRSRRVSFLVHSVIFELKAVEATVYASEKPDSWATFEPMNVSSNFGSVSFYRKNSNNDFLFRISSASFHSFQQVFCELVVSCNRISHFLKRFRRSMSFFCSTVIAD